MLIKWEDLLPGDVIRFTMGAEKFYKRFAPLWAKEWCNKYLIIKEININSSIISITFYNGNNKWIDKITLNGYDYEDIYQNGPLLEIISLIN